MGALRSQAAEISSGIDELLDVGVPVDSVEGQRLVRQRIRLLDVRPGATYTPMWGEVDDHQRAQMMVARDVANPMVDALLLPSRGSVEQLTIRPIEGDI